MAVPHFVSRFLPIHFSHNDSSFKTGRSSINRISINFDKGNFTYLKGKLFKKVHVMDILFDLWKPVVVSIWLRNTRYVSAFSNKIHRWCYPGRQHLGRDIAH